MNRPQGCSSLPTREIADLTAVWDPRLPPKVRKILLLQAADLPLNETFVFERDVLSLGDLATVISTANRFLSQGRRVVLRTAWVPALANAPWFRAPDESALNSALQSLRDAQFEPPESRHRFTHIILHADTAHPKDPSERYSYLAGRFLLHPRGDLPVERTLEIVWAEHFAKILDVGGLDLGDERFAAYRIETGHVGWRPLKESPAVSAETVRMLITRFKDIEDPIRRLRQALGFIHGVTPGEVSLVLEFQATTVPPWLFHIYDFDYAFRR